MIPADGNFRSINWMTLSPCQKRPAAGQRTEGAAEVQKSPHRPPSHRTSTKPSGGRGVTGAKPAAASKAKKDGVVANVGVPPEEKVDVVHPLQQTVLIRGRANFLSPECNGGREGECVSMRQSDMPSACYLSANLEQWYPHFCPNFSTPGKAIVFNVCLNEVDPVCWNGRGGPRRTFLEVVSMKYLEQSSQNHPHIFQRGRARPPS